MLYAICPRPRAGGTIVFVLTNKKLAWSFVLIGLNVVTAGFSSHFRKSGIHDITMLWINSLNNEACNNEVAVLASEVKCELDWCNVVKGTGTPRPTVDTAAERQSWSVEYPSVGSCLVTCSGQDQWRRYCIRRWTEVGTQLASIHCCWLPARHADTDWGPA